MAKNNLSLTNESKNLVEDAELLVDTGECLLVDTGICLLISNGLNNEAKNNLSLTNS
ncbi:MAG: hypothetical protein V2I33_22855 [Kangiellaceae bacterium]|jgi:hypothetical protein|nr:hypothetical protein [Kangiellaceae bacterium]